MNSPSAPWIWAYDSIFVPMAISEFANVGEIYDGRLKIAFNSLFTWFYAARKENVYNMEMFWEKARQQTSQAWAVETTMGRYHGPLVLLEKGTRWPFNNYELNNEV